MTETYIDTEAVRRGVRSLRTSADSVDELGQAIGRTLGAVGLVDDVSAPVAEMATVLAALADGLDHLCDRAERGSEMVAALLDDSGGFEFSDLLPLVMAGLPNLPSSRTELDRLIATALTLAPGLTELSPRLVITTGAAGFSGPTSSVVSGGSRVTGLLGKAATTLNVVLLWQESWDIYDTDDRTDTETAVLASGRTAVGAGASYYAAPVACSTAATLTAPAGPAVSGFSCVVAAGLTGLAAQTAATWTYDKVIEETDPDIEWVNDPLAAAEDELDRRIDAAVDDFETATDTLEGLVGEAFEPSESGPFPYGPAGPMVPNLPPGVPTIDLPDLDLADLGDLVPDRGLPWIGPTSPWQVTW